MEKLGVSPKNVCVCVDDECLHLACRPAAAFMVEVMYASFVFQIIELVTTYLELNIFNLTILSCFFVNLLFVFNCLCFYVDRTIDVLGCYIIMDSCFRTSTVLSTHNGLN